MIPVINLLSEFKFRLPKIFVYFILIWFRKIVNVGKYHIEIREALTSMDLDTARDQLKIPSSYHPDLMKLRDIHE